MVRWRSLVAWLVVAPWAAWAVVRLAGLDRGFPLVQLMTFTPYAVPAALVAALVSGLVLRRRAPALGALVAAAAIAAVVAPRAIGDGATARAGHAPLRLMTANVRLGGVPPAEIIALVRRQRVDVLALQELTPELASALKRAGLRRILPYAVLRPVPEAAGTGIYSRTPLRETPGPAGTRFALSTAEVRPGVRLVAVHTVAPRGPALTRRWNADFRSLGAARAEILAGDFNATLDHRRLRGLLDRGYTDAADAVGAGLCPTWGGARTPPLTLDHVLVARGIGVLGVSVHALTGSDHRAVLAVLDP